MQESDEAPEQAIEEEPKAEVAETTPKTLEEMLREQGELLQEILKKVKDVRRRLPPAGGKGGGGGGGKGRPGGAKPKKPPPRQATMSGAARGR